MGKKSPSNNAECSASIGVVRAVLVAIVVAPFIVFPPIRLAPQKAPGSSVTSGTFSAHEFAAKFWAAKLVPGLGSAIDARSLYLALDSNPSDTAKRLAHAVGIGGTAYYFTAGEGVVTAVDGDSVTIALADGEKNTVVLDTGLVFGNAVRDGTGLLDVNTFANSEAFNAVASELNTIVETTVLPSVRQLGTVGAKISFTGIAEITGTDGDPRPLHLVPLKVEIKP